MRVASTQSVVELTIGHLLSSVRHVAKSDRSMRGGKWEKKQFKGSELAGKNLGLVGFGRIAQGVGAIAQSLGMNVHAYDPYLPPKIAKNQNTRLHKSVDTLFSNCTHISIHCNLTDETHHLVNYNRISKMPGKSIDGIQCGNHIVNCARGGIVNENDVLKALNDGLLATAALDVFEEEPVPEDTNFVSILTSTQHRISVHQLSRLSGELDWTLQEMLCLSYQTKNVILLSTKNS